MLPSLPDYERLVYTLQTAYPSIECSTLEVIRRGPAFTELSGSLEFPDDIIILAHDANLVE